MDKKPKLVAILGPTATGKSALALELAKECGGEIISADSVQVYRGLDIGSAKPTVEQRRQAPHHLIDILDPDQDYSASAFREQADEIIQRLHRESTPIFVAGGTGLYLKVLSRGLFRGPGGDPHFRSILRHKEETEGDGTLHRELLQRDPEAASRIHPRDTFRLIRALEVYHFSCRPISRFQREHGFGESRYHVLKIGLSADREELYRRVESRVEQMMEQGWREEVRALLARGYSRGLKSMQSLGYRRLTAHLAGEIDLSNAIHLIKQDTRQFAKRQVTWFKSDPDIRWFPAFPDSRASARAMISEFIHHC
jgi:tRNA dimethylallyltransferase